MTPCNIAGMGYLNGLRIMALTDHNTAKNCPAFYAACREYGIVPVSGMELTTAEDIHMVCLFPKLDTALAFDKLVEERRMKVKNKPAIFGEQIIMGEQDVPIGNDPWFLPAATSIPIEEGAKLVRSMGGVCYPAHIDREANGLLAVLGFFPTRCSPWPKSMTRTSAIWREDGRSWSPQTPTGSGRSATAASVFIWT